MTRRIALWGLYVGVLLAVAGIPIDIYFDLSDSHGVAVYLFSGVGILLVGWAVKSLWGPAGLARLLGIASALFLALAVGAAVFGIVETRFHRFGPQDIPVVGQLVLFLGVPACLMFSLVLFVGARVLKKESMQNGNGTPSPQGERDLKGDEKSGMPLWMQCIGVAVVALGLGYLIVGMVVAEIWRDLGGLLLMAIVGLTPLVASLNALVKAKEKGRVPPWLHHVAAAVIVLGIASLVVGLGVVATATQPGIWKGFVSGLYTALLGLLGFVVAIPPATVSSVVVHELGHLLAGWAMGYRFVAMQVGRFRVERAGKRLRFGFVQLRRDMGPFDGFVDIQPRGWQLSVVPEFVMVAGGPAAQLAFGCALLAIGFWPGLSGGYAVWIHLAENAVDGVLLPLIRVTGLAALVHGVIVLIPDDVDGKWNDGKRLMRLLQPNGNGVTFSAMLAVAASIAQGKRPRDWDRDAVMFMDRTDYPDGWIYVYYYHYDRDEIDDAGKVLDRLLGRTKEIDIKLRDWIFAEAAFYLAFHRRTGDSAQEFLERVEEPSRVYCAVLDRAKAAIQLASGDHAAAVSTAESALKAIEEGDAHHQAAVFAKRVLQEILAEAKSAEGDGV
ncbi:MAG: hypothetical protein IH851_02890 [Armatimonadetes bacterium]|nr:hypothetical protein [Armatimonadota bacterium]